MSALITPPAPRLAYEADGSVVLISRSQTNDHNPFEADYTTKAMLNSSQSYGLVIGSGLWDILGDYSPDSAYYAKNFIAIMFPRRTDLKAWFLNTLTQASWPNNGGTRIGGLYTQLQVSSNTTNGQDGTWTNIAEKLEYSYKLPYRFPNYNNNPSFSPAYEIGSGSAGIEFMTGHDLMYRDQGTLGPGWAPLSGADNLAGVRLFFPRYSQEIADQNGLGGTFNWAAFHLHLYGTASLVSENRLALMNAAGTGPANLTFGDMNVSEVIDRTIRVKNLSATKTAFDARITSSSGVPSATPGKHYATRYTLDGVDWLAHLRIGDIPPGGLSPEITLRIEPLAGMVGLQFPRVHAQAGEWS